MSQHSERKPPRDHAGFKCPECGSYRLSIIDTRGNSEGTKVRRRHECECGHRFTSFATIAPTGSVSKSA